MKTLLIQAVIIAHLFITIAHSNIIRMDSIIEKTETLKIPQSSDRTTDSLPMLHLDQPWNDQPDDSFRPSKIQLSWSPWALHIEAILVDDEIFTQATADNQKMWELGDVFEIFLQIEGREDYVELHITPNNKRMHAHKPNVEGKPSPDAEPLPIEKMFVSPVGFTSSVTQTTDGWKVNAMIPPLILGLDRFSSDIQLRVSFCRYDVTSNDEPTLSTTASHSIIAFHQPDEWTPITLSE